MLKQFGGVCDSQAICYGRNKRTGLQVLLGFWASKGLLQYQLQEQEENSVERDIPRL
jgi:hypothetical protein